MPDTFAAHPVLRDFWHPVLRATDLADAPVRVTLLTEPLALYRGPTGAPTAVPDRCAHREAPLSAGQLEDGCLVCPYHGWTYDGDGRCVRVPSNAAGVPVPPQAHLTPYHCVERYGLVWVCPGEPCTGIPEIPQDVDQAFRRINVEVQTWRTCALRMTDNFLDISHFPWVHAGTFGGATDPVVPAFDIEPVGDFTGYVYDVEVDNTDSAGAVATGASAATLQRHMTSGFALPFTVCSTIRYGSGLEHVILLLTTPVDDVTSYFTFVVWRNDDFSVPAEEVIRFDRAIGEEDRTMLERIPGVLPLARAGRVCDVRADRTGLEWRRRLAALLDGDRSVLGPGAGER